MRKLLLGKAGVRPGVNLVADPSGKRVQLGSALVLSDAQRLVRDLSAYMLRRAYVGDLSRFQGNGAACVAGDPLSAACATWQDQSGNNLSATQGTVMSQPLLVASAINGRDALRFDGMNDVFNLAVGGTFDTFGIVLVGTIDTDASTYGILGRDGNGAPTIRVQYNSNVVTEKGGLVGMNVTNQAIPRGTPYLLAWSYDGTSSVLRVNDTSNTAAVSTTGFASLNLLGSINPSVNFPTYKGTVGCMVGCRAADMSAIRARLIDYYALPFAK